MNTAGPSRRPLPSQKSSPHQYPNQRDIWGLGLSSDLSPDQPPRPPLSRRRTDDYPTPSVNPDQHPLHRTQSPPRDDRFVEVLSDVSRPNLTRLTSDLEQRAESSRGSEDGSRRGSTDRLRMTSGEPQEVEVIVHQVQANESLAGIALLYGIDLATLRKTNKLWPSDPVHLRRHLYVPLEACRWNKASEVLIRGPGEGQVTLAPKASGKSKGKAKAKETENLISFDDQLLVQHSAPGSPRETNPWDISLPEPVNHLIDHPSSSPSSPRSQSPPPSSRTADIVRIPASQLRFFPQPPRRADSARASLDRGARLNGAPPPPPLSIQNDLHFSHNPVISRKSSLQSFGTVRLRPPTSAPSNGTSLADRMANIFYIPPPPSGGTLVPPPRSRPRKSLDSVRALSQGGSPTASPRPAEEVEMRPRMRRGSSGTAKFNNRDKRKLD